MSSRKPTFDSEQLTKLINKGTAEARADSQPFAAQPATPSTVDGRDTVGLTSVPNTQAAPPVAARALRPVKLIEESTPQPLTAEMEETIASPKRPITIRLSDEVLARIYHHQAELRASGAKLADTTVGGVIDTLLRKQFVIE